MKPGGSSNHFDIRVVVGIGHCLHFLSIAILVKKIVSFVIYFQSGARRESLKQMLTSEKPVLLLATKINPWCLKGMLKWKTLSWCFLEFERNSRVKFQPQFSLVRSGFQKKVTIDLRWNSTCQLCWQKRGFSVSIYYTKEINATISIVCLNQSVYAARSSLV